MRTWLVTTELKIKKKYENKDFLNIREKINLYSLEITDNIGGDR